MAGSFTGARHRMIRDGYWGRCADCGQPNVPWMAVDKLWRCVLTRAGRALTVVLCPTCFVRQAEHVGVFPPSIARDPDRPKARYLWRLAL